VSKKLSNSVHPAIPLSGSALRLYSGLITYIYVGF